jgi:quercetin dioxygenase-like cupin family protein
MSQLDRASLQARLRKEGLEPSSWSSLPDERFEQHSHDFDKIVVVVDGSITFGIPGYGVGFVLGRGERLDLPAGLGHDAVVGPKGVTCFEIHVPAGTIGTRARGRGYHW